MLHQHTILVIADELARVKRMQHLLGQEYHVLGATGAADGLVTLRQETVHVVVTDQRMPEMSGVELLCHLQVEHPDIVGIVVTGVDDARAGIDAVKLGTAFRYVLTPWDPDDLRGIIRQACEKYDLAADHKKLLQDLKAKGDDLEAAYEDLAVLRTELRAVSHDLQEPLRMVREFLTRLEEQYKPQLDDKAREYISFSVGGAARMSNLLEDLLEYTRAGRKDTKLKPVDANRPLAAALANLSVVLTKAGATVTHGDLPRVIGDETQFMRLFQNLIGNAVKFRSPQRPCQVHVSAALQEGKWVFAVQDNGIGIPATQSERIFRIFQRLHTQDQYPGTGIGLAICKKIVERHRGSIWVESKVSDGSTFYFTISPPLSTQFLIPA